MNEVTELLSAIESGDRLASDQLLPLVYDELRRLAAYKLANEKPGQTLDATALVHEAYVRLVGHGEQDENDPGMRWDNRGHFFAAAAEAMRRILIDNARRKRAVKHGGDRNRVEMDDTPQADVDDRILELDAALKQLAKEDQLAAKVVELRQFAGLTHEGVAGTLGLTTYRARQKWTYARAWLKNEMSNE